MNRGRAELALALGQEHVSAVAAMEGLYDMVVPEGCEDLMREIRDGAEVCDRLIMLNYGDTCDVESDNPR
jgi:gamma-glutamyl phosphate reductase